jgi:cytochrome P450
MEDVYALNRTTYFDDSSRPINMMSPTQDREFEIRRLDQLERVVRSVVEAQLAPAFDDVDVEADEWTMRVSVTGHLFDASVEEIKTASTLLEDLVPMIQRAWRDLKGWGKLHSAGVDIDPRAEETTLTIW